MTAMRQVQDMTVEFVNAFNAAAESECAKLRRLLEEERKLVQRLKQENEDEAHMAKEKIEKMSHLLTEARKNVDYATSRADFAENEWVKVKRELQEARELLQLLKTESEETRQGVLRQVDDKELELADTLDDASTAENECDKLMIMLEEVRKLVQRHILEKDDEAQLAKRQIEEIGQELDDTRKYAEYANTRADVAEYECAQLKRMLEEEQKLVRRLRFEKDDEVRLANTQIREIDQELACARNDAELAQTDADVAEVKRDLKRMEELVKLQLECQEMRESARRQDEEKALELANALNASAISESECAKLKRMLVEERKTVHRLISEKNYEEELAKREIEKIGQELTNARKDAQYARKEADIAKNEWFKLKRELMKKEEFLVTLKMQILVPMCQVEELSQELEHAQREAEYARNDADHFKNEWIREQKELQEMLEFVHYLQLQCQEIRESAMRQVEQKELELADALHAASVPSSSSSVAKVCAICLMKEKDTAFGCGHMTCEKCGMMLSTCPICRVRITHRIKLFPG